MFSGYQFLNWTNRCLLYGLPIRLQLWSEPGVDYIYVRAGFVICLITFYCCQILPSVTGPDFGNIQHVFHSAIPRRFFLIPNTCSMFAQHAKHVVNTLESLKTCPKFSKRQKNVREFVSNSLFSHEKLIWSNLNNWMVSLDLVIILILDFNNYYDGIWTVIIGLKG